MFNRSRPLYFPLIIALLFSSLAEAQMEPPKVVLEEVTLPAPTKCGYVAAAYQNQLPGAKSLTDRLTALLEITTPRAPRISPQQLWMVSILADYSKTGLTAKQLTFRLSLLPLARELDLQFDVNRVEESLLSMDRMRTLVFQKWFGNEEAPRYFARSEGVWEVLNALRFYRAVARRAFEVHYSRVRVSVAKLKADYIGRDVIEYEQLLGPAQCVILAQSARKGRLIALDVLTEVVRGLGLGTPPDESAGYDIMSNLYQQGLLGEQEMNNTEPHEWQSDETDDPRNMKYRTYETTAKGLQSLFTTLYFYLKSDEMLRAHTNFLGAALRNYREPVIEE